MTNTAQLGIHRFVSQAALGQTTQCIYIYISLRVYSTIHGCIMSYTMYDMSYVNLTAKKKSCTKFNKWMMIYQNI